MGRIQTGGNSNDDARGVDATRARRTGRAITGRVTANNATRNSRRGGSNYAGGPEVSTPRAAGEKIAKAMTKPKEKKGGGGFWNFNANSKSDWKKVNPFNRETLDANVGFGKDAVGLGKDIAVETAKSAGRMPGHFVDSLKPMPGRLDFGLDIGEGDKIFQREVMGDAEPDMQAGADLAGLLFAFGGGAALNAAKAGMGRNGGQQIARAMIPEKPQYNPRGAWPKDKSPDYNGRPPGHDDFNRDGNFDIYPPMVRYPGMGQMEQAQGPMNIAPYGLKF